MGIARGQITITNVNDGVSTYTKQVYMTSFTRPLKPSGASPNGWSESVPATYKFENAMDSSHNGYRVAKGNLANDFIKERLSFVVSSATSVNIEIEASSESGYDFIAVGDVDTDLDTRAKVTSLAAASKASGTEKKTVTRSLSAGTHYIDIVYSKDASGNYKSDCGWYKVKSVSGAVMTTLPNRLWVSVAKLTDGALDGSWSTPIPYDSVDGGSGEDGADGYTVTTYPSNIIIEQDDDKNLDHFTLPLDVQFCAFKGGSVVSVTDVSIVGTPIGVTVAKKSGSTDTTTISAIAKINNKYQRDYEYTARVSFDGVTRDVTVPVYVSFVATITRDVQNGVETTVAQKLGFKAAGSDVYSIEAAGNFIRSAEEHTSQLDKYVKGRNLIPNVLTASGWSNVGVLDGGGIYRTGSAYARTPRFKVNKNTGHVLSFYEMVAKPLGQYVSITIFYYSDSSTTTEYSHTTTYTFQYTQVTDNNDTTYIRKYKTITTPDVSGSLYAEISISTISTEKPIFMLQLEEGSTPTPFDAETKDVGSIVKQTAEDIEMKVGRCGLDIDEESITASGGKFKMQDDSGHTTFELDENGNLVSNGNAAFGGTLITKKFRQLMCYVRPLASDTSKSVSRVIDPDNGGFLAPFYYKTAISDGGYADEYVTENNISVGEVFYVPESVQNNFDSEHFVNCIGFTNIVVITNYVDSRGETFAFPQGGQIIVPPPSTCPGVAIRFINRTENYALIKTYDEQTVFHLSLMQYPSTSGGGILHHLVEVTAADRVALKTSTGADNGMRVIPRETMIYSDGTYWILINV